MPDLKGKDDLMIGISISLKEDIGIGIVISTMREGMSQLDSILSWTSRISRGKLFPGLVEHSGVNL